MPGCPRPRWRPSPATWASGGRAKAVSSLANAFAEILGRRPGRVLVAGSLYLAGELLTAEGKPAWPA